jgi:hypothetical protein
MYFYISLETKDIKFLRNRERARERERERMRKT